MFYPVRPSPFQVLDDIQCHEVILFGQSVIKLVYHIHRPVGIALRHTEGDIIHIQVGAVCFPDNPMMRIIVHQITYFLSDVTNNL